MVNLVAIIVILTVASYQIYGEVMHRREWSRLIDKEHAYAEQRKQNKD